MKKQMIFAAVAAITVLATACNNEKTPRSAVESGAIEFRALVDKNAQSRASLVDNLDQLTNFFVAGGLAPVSPAVYDLNFMQAAVYRTGPAGSYVWNYAPKKYYPIDDTPINFFAYAPIKDVNMSNNAELNIDSGTGEVSFGYTVPADQSVSNTAADLLVSSVLCKVDDGTSAAFAFNHALSAVYFTAANLNPDNSELTYIVSNVEITGLYNTGTFTYPFSPSSWTSTGSNTAVYTAGIPEAGGSLISHSTPIYVNLLSANDIMMVLPQLVTVGTVTGGVPNNDGSYVNVTFSLKDGTGDFIYLNRVRTLTLPAGFTFESGTLYNFQFEFAASDAITFSVTALSDWTTPTVVPLN